MQDFLARMVDAYTIGRDATRVGLVNFAEQVDMYFTMDSFNDAASVKAAIKSMPYLGTADPTTNTPEALRVARTQCFDPNRGARPDKTNVVIIVTDGLPTPSNREEEALNEAAMLANGHTIVVAVGITNAVTEDYIRGLSSRPKELNKQYFLLPNFNALTSIYSSLSVTTCPTEESKYVKFICMFGWIFHSFMSK